MLSVALTVRVSRMTRAVLEMKCEYHLVEAFAASHDAFAQTDGPATDAQGLACFLN